MIFGSVEAGLVGKHAPPVLTCQELTKPRCPPAGLFLCRALDRYSTGIVLDALPVLIASEHSVDYTCGRCRTILMHAEEDQVRGFLIRCTSCGTYNSLEM
jgi:DNA-directed RNA polymerase subunit RPC12/RpoP